jgi:uncharacterized protein (UPF0303 family)
LYGIEASNQARLLVVAGGIPLELGGRIVGAIGVSGGSVEEDHDVAQAAVAALRGGLTAGRREGERLGATAEASSGPIGRRKV